MQSRLVWLDVVRGLAVLSMFVAHVAPVGGIFNVTEYLTAPLFAMTIGASAALAWDSWRGSAGRFVTAYALRGALLFLSGLALQPVYNQIVVVLQWLGIVTVLIAPLVVLLKNKNVVSLAMATTLVAVAPISMEAARMRVPLMESPLLRDALTYFAASPYYRVIPMMAASLIGAALVRWLNSATVKLAVILMLLAGTLSGAIILAGKVSGYGADPYSGTYFEIVGSLAIAVAAMGAARATGNALAGWKEPLVALGQLAFTAYALQLVILRIIVDGVLDGGRDDHWWVLGVLIVSVTAICWAWRRWIGNGPLERLLRIPTRAMRQNVVCSSANG